MMHTRTQRWYQGILRFTMLAAILTGAVLLQAGSAATGTVTAAEPPEPFELRLDSRFRLSGPDTVTSHHVQASIILNPTPGQSTRFTGLGRLEYTEFTWDIPGNPCSYALSTRGSSLTVQEAIIPAEEAPVTLRYRTGAPAEVITAFCPGGSGSTEAILWYASYYHMHRDEIGPAGLTATDWTFPGGGVYARKTYRRSTTVDDVLIREDTTIELIGRPDTPTIEEMSAKGVGTTGSEPETGSKVELSATIDNPDPAAYAIDRCRWTGDLPSPGEGDPNDDCRYEYTPSSGHGPNRQTYGDKDVQLTITYRHRESGATGEDRKSHTYKVYFPKDEDDLGNGDPNWFDFWADDGAVPELDASDIDFDSTTSSYGAWDPDTDRIELGRGAAEVHYPNGLNVPSSAVCPGGSFGGAKGIDSVAEVIAHERTHETLYENWHGGPWIIGETVDSDDTTPNRKGDIVGDLLPDTFEESAGTDPNDLDSCNLAAIKSSVYSTYGDEEFQCVLVGDGKTGNASNDWANPGKQTTSPFMLAASRPPSRSGLANEASRYRPKKTFPGVADLSGSYVSRVTDEDSDGLFDSLVIDVGVNVLTEGSFNLVGWLQDSVGDDIAWASYSADLPVGTHTLPLTFDGRLLNAHGVDGPYTLAQVQLRFGDHEDGADASSVAHTTPGYLASEFEPYAAALSGSYSHRTTDEDSDGLYDELQIAVGVEVREAGIYRLVGQLAKGEMLIAESAEMALNEGAHDVVLSFDGAALFHYGQDGPYELNPVWIEDAAGERLDVDRGYMTPAYLSEEFEHGSITIQRESYADRVVDRDEDGDDDVLAVDFSISSDASETVRVWASLEGPAGAKIASAQALVVLEGFPMTPAFITATLEFDGRQISAQGVDGPYRLVSLTLMSAGGEVLDVHPLAMTTEPYQAADFDGPGPTPTPTATATPSPTPTATPTATPNAPTHLPLLLR